MIFYEVTYLFYFQLELLLISQRDELEIGYLSCYVIDTFLREFPFFEISTTMLDPIIQLAFDLVVIILTTLFR